MLNYRRLFMLVIFLLCVMLSSCDQGSSNDDSPRIQIIQNLTVDQKLNPNHSQPFIYFDEANNLQLGFESYNTVKSALSQTCSVDELKSNPYFRSYPNSAIAAKEINDFNTRYYNVLLNDPKVVYLFCGNVPYSFKQYLVGIGSNGEVLWKYLAPFRFNIVNASSQGLIYQYLNNLGDKGLLGVFSPQTGQLMYQPSGVMFPRGIYAYNAAKHMVYLVTSSSSKENPAKLYEINTDTGGTSLRNALPQGVNPTDAAVTSSNKYLTILANSPAGRIVLIYDLKNNQWVGQKTLAQVMTMGIPLIIFGKTDDVGILLKEQQAYHLIHLHITEYDNVKK